MDGNSRSTSTTLLRGPEKSKHEVMTACVVVTFWCSETLPAGAPISAATLSPTVEARSHQLSSHARTPRVAHDSAYSRTLSYTPRGIAPSELLIMYVVRPRMGNSSRHFSNSSKGSFAGVLPAGVVQLPIHPTHAQILHDEVILDPVLRPLPPHARFLHAAEGRDFGGDDAGVDADDAVLEGFGDAPDAVDVASVEVRRQAEFGVVREADRFFFVREAEERRDRAEGFFAGHFHAGVDVGEDGRFEEGSAERVALAAGQEFRAFRQGVAD